MDLRQYIEELNRQYRTGLAREHSYRPALKELLQGLLPNMVVTNEPARFECGAPDFIISREKDNLPVFFVEAKDVGDTDLDGNRESQHKEQFDRYKQALDHIFFTDYLDFHLYENGEFVDSVRIADIKGDRIVAIIEAEDKFLGLIQHVANSAMQRITSASKLAKLMAGKARLLSNIIETAMSDNAQTYDNDNLRGQYNAFKDVLIHDLEQAEFADIYAQTIAYGMFAARLHDDTDESFSRQKAASLIPKSNPFLRQFFNHLAGNDLDERIVWVVDDLVALFAATDIHRVMTSYGRNKRHHDPMIHFYEDFLAEYNPELRRSKGVWYTPQPVVGFIVRAVDEILQREFGLKEGLADYSTIDRQVAAEQIHDKRTKDGMKHIMKSFHRVQILDPATGTGTFLAEVINQIYDRFRNQQGIWQQYVENHLIPRLNGFEILMASYAVAHLKLDMLLGETGYQHKTDKRLHVYLTNSLEESNNEHRSLFSQWLAREATEANIIKREYPVMVIIGNPPYSVSSQNNGKWITALIADYKKNLNERNIQPLSDDYIKFIRLGQYYVEKNGEGVLAFICNNSFVDGIIHRQMRKELMRAFDKIYILDLHGNSRKKETAPNGDKDENVFDIMQGVSINILCRVHNISSSKCQVYHYDLYGSREDKYKFLDSHQISDVSWTELIPKEPQYFFVPKDFTGQEEYERWFKIDDLFLLYNSGIKTQKDKASIFFTKQDGISLYNDFINLPVAFLKRKYQFTNTRDWRLELAREDLLKNSFIYTQYCYRPFDYRYCIYTGKTKGIMGYPRHDLMKNLLNKDNVSLLTCRQEATFDFQHAFVTKYISDMCSISSQTKESGYVFPLFIYKEDNGVDKCVPNFNTQIVMEIDKSLGERVNPFELFDYIYAVLYSPSYRERYKEFLKIDFPRIPYPNNAETYHNLASKGAQLRHLHLMEGLPNETGVTFPVVGSMQVDYFQWHNDRVYINTDQYFENVPELAWKFYIGGYQPAQKWLKDRKSRTLSFEDVKHYERIIYVLCRTEQLMTEIDSIM